MGTSTATATQLPQDATFDKTLLAQATSQNLTNFELPLSNLNERFAEIATTLGYSPTAIQGKQVTWEKVAQDMGLPVAASPADIADWHDYKRDLIQSNSQLRKDTATQLGLVHPDQGTIPGWDDINAKLGLSKKMDLEGTKAWLNVIGKNQDLTPEEITDKKMELGLRLGYSPTAIENGKASWGDFAEQMGLPKDANPSHIAQWSDYKWETIQSGTQQRVEIAKELGIENPHGADFWKNVTAKLGLPDHVTTEHALSWYKIVQPKNITAEEAANMSPSEKIKAVNAVLAEGRERVKDLVLESIKSTQDYTSTPKQEPLVQNARDFAQGK